MCEPVDDVLCFDVISMHAHCTVNNNLQSIANFVSMCVYGNEKFENSVLFTKEEARFGGVQLNASRKKEDLPLFGSVETRFFYLIL